jgi:putative FmdB family regulatory protein
MPIYEYRCERGHTFEEIQRMADEPLASCSSCGAPVERVFHPVAVHFKGSGFYSTDYAKNKAGSPADSTTKRDGNGSGTKESASTDSGSKKAGSKDSGSD